MEKEMIDGKLALHPAEVLVKLGYSRDLKAAGRTARNLLWLGKYPLPVTWVLGKPRVLATDVVEALKSAEEHRPVIAETLAIQSEKANSGTPTAKRSRGRPRKTISNTAVKVIGSPKGSA